jgi:hypothetical protein
MEPAAAMIVLALCAAVAMAGARAAVVEHTFNVNFWNPIALLDSTVYSLA